MVVGRDARLTSLMGIATKLPVDRTRVDLAVGRDLRVNSSGINNGSVTYGRTIAPLGFSVPNGTVTKAAPPFDVDALFDGLVIRSTSWAELDSRTPVFATGTLVLTGTDPVRNVWTIDHTLIERASTLRIRVPDGATTLINVRGGSFVNTLGSGMFIWDDATGYVQVGNPAQNDDLEARRRAILWNFPEASSVTLGPPGTAWQGSVLAPRARVNLGYQHIFGSIVAESVYGTGEIGVNPPDPCLPDPTRARPLRRRRRRRSRPRAPRRRPRPRSRRSSPTPSPSPTPTAIPTPTPTVTPRPTPLPTVSPSPIVTPTATPEENDPSEPLRPRGDARHDRGRTRRRRRRHLQEGDDAEGPGRRATPLRAGQVVKFRIRVTTWAPTSPRTCSCATSSRAASRSCARP